MDVSMLWIVLAGFACALVTSATLAAVFWIWVRPRMLNELNVHMDRKVEEAAVELEERVEAAVRKGIQEGVVSLASRETLEGTTRNLARSSAELMEDRLNRIFGGRGSRGRGGSDR